MHKAQTLFFRIEALRRQGKHAAAARLYPDMALLHASRAFELLEANDVDGWIDLFAAVTTWGNAGRRSTARRTVEGARRYAAALATGRENVEEELASLERWVARRLSIATEVQISIPPMEPGELLDVVGRISLHHWTDVSIFDPVTGRSFPSYWKTPFHDLTEVLVYRRGAAPFDADTFSSRDDDAAHVHAHIDFDRVVLAFDAPGAPSAAAIASAVRQTFTSLLFQNAIRRTI